MKVLYGLVAACAVIAQPAWAQEVSIRCSTVSDMKIYNPHGKGGIIGGPTNYTKTLRTDGRSLWETGDKGTVQHRDVELTSSGLSWCGADAGVQCGTAETLYKNDGTYIRQVGRTFISTSGEYRFGFSVFNSSASMKTGVAVEEAGTCDAAGIDALRALAGGGGGASGGDNRSSAAEQSRGDDRADASSSSNSNADDDASADDNARDAEQERLARQEREAAEAAEAARLRAEEAKRAREKADADRRRKEEDDRVAKEQADAERKRKEAEELAAREKAKAEAKQRAEQERKREERMVRETFNGQATTCPGGGTGILYLRTSKPPRLGCNVQFQARCAGPGTSVVNFAQNNYIGGSCLGIGDAIRIGQMPCGPEQVQIEMTSASCG